MKNGLPHSVYCILGLWNDKHWQIYFHRKKDKNFIFAFKKSLCGKIIQSFIRQSANLSWRTQSLLQYTSNRSKLIFICKGNCWLRVPNNWVIMSRSFWLLFVVWQTISSIYITTLSRAFSSIALSLNFHTLVQLQRYFVDLILILVHCISRRRIFWKEWTKENVHFEINSIWLNNWFQTSQNVINDQLGSILSNGDYTMANTLSETTVRYS